MQLVIFQNYQYELEVKGSLLVWVQFNRVIERRKHAKNISISLASKTTMVKVLEPAVNRQSTGIIGCCSTRYDGATDGFVGPKKDFKIFSGSRFKGHVTSFRPARVLTELLSHNGPARKSKRWRSSARLIWSLFRSSTPLIVRGQRSAPGKYATETEIKVSGLGG